MNAIISTQKKTKILIVDDTPVMLMILKKFLQMEGYKVLPADNGPKAREIAEAENPDLILLDIMMPGESGLETCEILKSNSKTANIPVIFISAITDVDSKVEGFEKGAVDYITKPFEKLEVLARVRLHLKLKVAYETIIKTQAEKLQQVKEAQESILVNPEDLPEANFSVSYRPIQEAGGDFYDVFCISDDIYGYFVSDVSGHDLRSSYLTSALKALLAQNANVMYRPEETMKMMNQILTTIAADGKYLTGVYVHLNRIQSKLTIINAGHPAIIYLSHKGDITPIEAEGDVLGAFENVFFTPIIQDVEPKDRFYVYTDGFIEGFGDEKITRAEGIENLCQLILKTKEMTINESVKYVNDTMFPEDKPQEDDLLFLGVEI